MLSYEQALSDAARGNSAGLADVYAREKPQLLNAATRISHNRSSAEDIVHDAFAMILRDAHQFDQRRGSARAWIYTIIRNTALKSLRRTMREIATPDEALQTLSNVRHVSEKPCDPLYVARTLEECLVAMEPRRRATIVMALIDGRTHNDIASELDVPIGTVKAWIKRELTTLRQRLR